MPVVPVRNVRGQFLARRAFEDEHLWAALRNQFTSEVFDHVLATYQDAAISQIEALGLGVDYDLANVSVYKLAGKYVDDWWAALEKATRRGLHEAMQSTIAAGGGPRELAKAITPLFGEQRASTIAATELTRMYAEGNRIGYRLSGVTETQWRTVSDSLVDPVCDELDGTRQVIGEEEIVPPAHPNCVIGDTIIASPEIRATSKRFYNGSVVEVILTSGDRLTVTPNHPILTSSGFVAAHLLEVGGDVIRCLDSERVIANASPDDYQIPALISEVVEALQLASPVLVEMPAATEDFHGDGEGSEVYVVGPTRPLWKEAFQPTKQKSFVARHLSSGLDSPSALAQIIRRALATTHGIVRRARISLPLLRSPLSLQDAVSVTLGALDSAMLHHRVNEVTRDSVLVREPDFERSRGILRENSVDKSLRDAEVSVAGLPGLVATRIVGVVVKHFSGHVYNLQTSTGWYVASNIITHNCRCWLAPIVDNEELKEWGQKYSDDQERDDSGRWTDGGGSESSVDRVFTGAPVPITDKPAKYETGRIGERVILDFLRKQEGLKDTRAINTKVPNFPIDLTGDHKLIEVKAGLVSNSAGAQQWRVTQGEPGKATKDWLANEATEKEKEEFNLLQSLGCIQRKEAVLRDYPGFKGVTYTTIINPDTKTADIYAFDGFHERIGWRSDAARDGYVTTVRYD